MKAKLLLALSLFVFQYSFSKSAAVADPVIPTVFFIPYCDPNNDGIGEFDFHDAASVILAAQSGNVSDYQVTYHVTPNDSSTGNNPLPSPYNNIVPWSQVVYYRIRNINTNAFATGVFELRVNRTPEAITPVDYSLCDYNGNGMELFDLTTKTAEILGSLNPASHTVTFHTTLVDANTGTAPVSTVSSNVGVQTVYARLTDDATGCFDIVSFHLIVEPIPNSMQPNYPQYVLCDADTSLPGYETFDLTSKYSSIIMGQTGVAVTFYPSLGDAQNNIQEITNPSAYVNQVIYIQTLGIRLTNQVTGCYSISTMDIRVEALPQLAAPSVPYVVCDANQDGIAIFDLTALAPSLQVSVLNTLTFHETLMDAQTGNLPITTPYANIHPFTQTIYARALDIVSGCYAIVPIELQVNPAPIAPLQLPSIVVCDTDSNTQDGTTLVDLTQQTPNILAQQPLAASNYTVSYYSSMTDAEGGTGQIIPPTNYVGSYGQTIWCRVENNSTECYAIGSFQLTVNTPLLLTTPGPLSVCDADANPNNQYVTFDLTVKNNEITQGLAGYTVTFYPTLANAQAGTNPIANPTSYINIWAAIQTVGVRVTSPSGCISITTLDIRALPIPNNANTNPPALAPKCDENNPGDLMENFDLTTNAAYIINLDPNLTLHYFPTIMEAENNMNEIMTPTNALVGGNVWIRVENNRVDFQGNSCYVLVEQPLTVYPMPNPIINTANNLNTVYVDGSNGIVVQPLLLNSSITGNFSYEWYEISNSSMILGTSPTYLVDTASLNNTSREYSVHVTNLSTGCDMTSVPYTVLQSDAVPPPSGFISQSLPAGSTLADIVVSGTNVQWYTSATGKNNLSMLATPLPLNTVLVNNTTYHASQTIGGIESVERLPVTVHLTLAVDDNEILPIQYAPNPVKNSLTLHSTKVLKSVVVYTILGQKVLEEHYDANDITLDLSSLNPGNYILKAQGETGQKTIRIIKE